MLRIAILDDYQRVALDMADWKSLGPDVDIAVFDRHLGSVDEAAVALADAEVLVCMRERMPLPRELIERLPRLRYIVSTGTHTTVIDFEAAAARGIPVSKTSAGPSPAAAEMTWALVLACARHIPREADSVRAGGWQTRVGMQLHGKTLGLIGLGRLGQVVAGYGRAFGMTVLAWSQNLTAERAAELGATYVQRDELLASSDIVSIHLKLSPRSQGLIGARELARMKPTAILINTSRGPIVDEAALIDVLRERRILAAGLDVFDQEPLPAGHPLRTLDNAIVTPHIGFVTDVSYDGFYRDAVAAIAAWRAGSPPDVASAPRLR